MDKPGILWIIGAGASKHVGMPLLNDFRPFFQRMWRYRINRKLLRDVLPKAMEIMDVHPTQNIEALLLPSSRLRNVGSLTHGETNGFPKGRGRLGRWMRARLAHTSLPGTQSVSGRQRGPGVPPALSGPASVNHFSLT